MNPARMIAALLMLVLGACAYIAPLQPAATFYVMRHLDTAAGLADPGLTEEGKRKAQLLADSFPGQPPSSIFVSNTRRARETAAPLAARLGITPRIYDPANTPALIAELMKEPPPILIVGHSNTVPDIVAALGGARPAPIAQDQFGDLWTVSGSRHTVTRTRIGG
jgi:broad specificity phosphatase PhoE